MITATTITEPALGLDGLYRLMALMSPSYPIGAFSYSHGIEWAVEDGLVCDRATLTAWLRVIVTQGAGFTDAVLLARAHAALVAGDEAALEAVVELAAALRGSAELALETEQQGGSFLRTTAAVWPAPRLDAMRARWADRPVALPVVIALATAGTLPVQAVVLAFLHALTGNLASAGMRLVPLGQTDGQRAIADLRPAALDAAARAVAMPLDEIGSAAVMIDWTSMRHETQYTRLFRS